MAFLDRYDLDRTRPDAATVRRDLVVRVLLPGIVLFGILTGLGFLLKGPLGSLAASEERINTYLVDHRTPLWNAITDVWSHIGNTEYVIGVCILLVALIWWRTKEWWYAVVPGIAISVQAAAFVPATNLVDRPRPTVPHLDPAPPTSSFPSGHVGAATALYGTLAMMAQRIQNRPLRPIGHGDLRRHSPSRGVCPPLPRDAPPRGCPGRCPQRRYLADHRVVVAAPESHACLRRKAGPGGARSDPRVAGASERIDPVGGDAGPDEGQQDAAEGLLTQGVQGAVEPGGLGGRPVHGPGHEE